MSVVPTVSAVQSESLQLRFAFITGGTRRALSVHQAPLCRGDTRARRVRGPSGLKGSLGVISVCFVCLKEMTMARRPTTQTTVTASLTKSSPGGCNLMSPARFASTYVPVCQRQSPPSLSVSRLLFPSITPTLLRPLNAATSRRRSTRATRALPARPIHLPCSLRCS